MKNLLLYLVLLLVAFGCAKTESVEPKSTNDLIGTWIIDSVTRPSLNYVDTAKNHDDTLIFEANNVMYMRTLQAQLNYDEFYYYTEGDSLFISDANTTTGIEYEVMNMNTLILSVRDEIEPDVHHYYSRIK